MPISVFLGVPRVSLRAVGGARAQLRVLPSAVLAQRAFSLAAVRDPRRQELRREQRGLDRRTRDLLRSRFLSTSSVRAVENKVEKTEKKEKDPELHESPYTIPNALTLARIAACPFLAYTIVQGNYEAATAILVAGGISDWVDGYIARNWNQKSVLGSILDPMADKTLMTTLVVCLTYQGLVPLPLAILIFGRDFALSLWAFYLRYISLPPPRTFKRYFDVSMPSAEVQPTQISKINTALQLLLMGITTVSPLLTAFPAVATGLHGLQWVVAGTTIWSGLSYIGASGFKILKKPEA